MASGELRGELMGDSAITSSYLHVRTLIAGFGRLSKRLVRHGAIGACEQ